MSVKSQIKTLAKGEEKGGTMVIPKLLLADDDEAVREMLQVALERDGFEVVAVASVKDALSRIAEEEFDVLLDRKSVV